MKSEKDIREQWNEAASTWVEFIRSGRNYYSEYLNGPALMQMIGDVKGKKVLDIGCGEGYTSRLLANEGAKVTGVDISQSLIEAALDEEKRHPIGVAYIAVDSADMSILESESFDLASCYMAMGDIENYQGAIKEVSRLLRSKGRFIIVMEHPCFMTRSKDGKIVAGWETNLHEDGSKDYLYYRLEDYLQQHSFTCEWKHERLQSSFTTTGFHRTLSDYVNTLFDCGFVITGLDEPQPMEKGVIVHPPMKKHYRIPQSIVIEATKMNI